MGLFVFLQTHYDILGLPSNASSEQIKASFRKLAKLYHPDKNPNGKEQFEKIVTAYEVLSDSVSRKRYDNKLNSKYASPKNHTATKPSQSKQWGFSEEELKRRQYYKENYKAEYNRYAQSKEVSDSDNKKSYYEYKYILFAIPLAVALFMLVIKGFEGNDSETTQDKTEEQSVSVLKMGSDPFTSYFKNPIYDTLFQRSVIVKNISSNDVVVNVYSDKNFARSCVVKVGFYIELEKLPMKCSHITFIAGKEWNSTKEYKNLDVYGGFNDSGEFYKLDLKKTNGWEITVDDALLESCEKISATEFFKRN